MAGLVRLAVVTTLAAGIALVAIKPAAAQSPPAGKPEMRRVLCRRPFAWR